MKYKVITSELAEAEMRDIYAYVYREAPMAADRLIQKLADSVESLNRLPLRGAKRDDILPGHRQLVVGPYLILYVVEGFEVTVGRVVDGRRDLFKP